MLARCITLGWRVKLAGRYSRKPVQTATVTASLIVVPSISTFAKKLGLVLSVRNEAQEDTLRRLEFFSLETDGLQTGPSLRLLAGTIDRN